jgi:hypothetical protein
MLAYVCQQARFVMNDTPQSKGGKARAETFYL